jgi:hypothetical protein
MLSGEVHLKAMPGMYEAHRVISPKQRHGLLQIPRYLKAYGGIPIVLMWVSGLFAKLTALLTSRKNILKGIICRILTEENSLAEQHLLVSE